MSYFPDLFDQRKKQRSKGGDAGCNDNSVGLDAKSRQIVVVQILIVLWIAKEWE